MRMFYFLVGRFSIKKIESYIKSEPASNVGYKKSV